jgi:hypothetical protein
MAQQHSAGDSQLLRLTGAELLWLNNALNEVCNGVDIDDAEFATRLGGSREELRRLLLRLHAMLQCGQPRDTA